MRGVRSSRPSPSRSSRSRNSAQSTAACEVVGALEHGAGLGQRRDHQRVPRGQALVVEAGPDAGRAGLEQPGADLGQRLGHRTASLEHDRAMLEAAAAPKYATASSYSSPEHRAQLVVGPHVELALDALGVGVERGVEATFGAAHLAQRPVERLAAHLAQPLLARDLPAVQVGARQQRVVVEHLLEVGDGPGGVDRVAREAAADLVVDPAGRHRAQRPERHLALAAREQELDRRGRRELRRAAEAAVGAVVGRARGWPSRRSGPRRGSAPPTARAARWRRATARRGSPCSRISSRRLSQASATASSTIRQLGMPWRGSGGK